MDNTIESEVTEKATVQVGVIGGDTTGDTVKLAAAIAADGEPVSGAFIGSPDTVTQEFSMVHPVEDPVLVSEKEAAKFMNNALTRYYEKYGKEAGASAKKKFAQQMRFMTGQIELVKSKIYGVIPKSMNNPKGIAARWPTKNAGTKNHPKKALKWHLARG